MSKLKAQLKAILPTLAAEANQCRDRESKERYYLIRAVVASKKSVTKVCGERGRSTDYFRKWAKRLIKQKSLQALASISRRPRHSPQQTRKRIEKRILRLRDAEPFQGPERISFDLKRLFNITCSPSTVYAVLKRHGRITKEHKKRLTKKHIKRYRRPFPGFMQMDVKYVPMLIDKQQYYEINVVDHCTTWRFFRILPSLEHTVVARFLREFEESCPFPVVEMQTDNGGEFTDKYRNGRMEPSGQHVLDQWCAQHGIRHRLIPLGEKELNGKVENTHKQDDREFYSQNEFRSLAHLQLLALAYNERWNRHRHTKALGWQTPEMALGAAYVRMLTWLMALQERYKSNEPLVRLDKEGNQFLPIPKRTSSAVRRQRGARANKISAVNRYLQWLAWDEKKSS